MDWWLELKPGSIYSYHQLTDAFMRHFDNDKTKKRPITYLANIVQRNNETLKNFMTRFSDALLLVEEHSLKEKVGYLHSNTKHKGLQAVISEGR